MTECPEWVDESPIEFVDFTTPIRTKLAEAMDSHYIMVFFFPLVLSFFRIGSLVSFFLFSLLSSLSLSLFVFLLWITCKYQLVFYFFVDDSKKSFFFSFLLFSFYFIFFFLVPSVGWVRCPSTYENPSSCRAARWSLYNEYRHAHVYGKFWKNCSYFLYAGRE